MEHTKGPVAHTSCDLSEDEFWRDGLGLISTARECRQNLHREPLPELVGRGGMGSSSHGMAWVASEDSQGLSLQM